MATSEEFTFRPIQDDNLFNHGERVKGKVVLITGAAAGIGKEAALRFSEHGGKLVIGDKNISGAQETVNEILKAGREATCKSCNVTVWDDLVDLFEHAINEYGTVDVVVANAGVSEIGQFIVPSFDKQGRLQKPNTATIDINVIGLLYTVHLAQHYLTKDGSSYVIKGDQPPTLKSIVLMGSISSWKGIPLGPLYTASKHAVLGIMRSLHPHLETQGIRISVVHPFFVDTAIVPLPVKFFLTGVPLTPVARVAAAIFYSATDPDVTTNGSAWMLLNDGPVVVVPKEDFKFGVYHAMDLRINAIQGGLDGIVYYSRILKDLARLLHLNSVLAVTVMVGVVGFISKTYQS